MDEAFGAPTRSRGHGFRAMCRRFSAQNLTVLFIAHDIDEAMFLGHGVLVVWATSKRVALDQEDTLSAQSGRVHCQEINRLAEFAELRKRITEAIER